MLFALTILPDNFPLVTIAIYKKNMYTKNVAKVLR